MIKKRIRCICLMALIVSMATGQSWEIYDSENSDLPEGTVNAVFVDEYGSKWFGTNQGLVHFTGAVWSTYTTEEGLVSEVINDLSGDMGAEESRLFVSTPQGVSEISYDATGLTQITSYNSSNSGLQSDSITTISLDTGVVYYGSPIGLNIKSDESWTFLDQISTIEGDVSLQQISSMAITPHGWNYVGTRERGVARVYYDVDGVTGASSYSTEWSGLLSDQINDIYIDADGDQWYATGKGLAFHMGYETKKNWETYTELSSGLIDNMIHTVAVDGNGTTWAGSDRGVSRYDGFTWLSYPYLDGITDYAVFDVDFDLDGSIWFASNIGVIHHDEMGFPDGVGPEQKTPNLKLNLFPSIASDLVNLEIEVPGHEHVSIFVVDLEGRIINRLTNRLEVSGSLTFIWNINDSDSQTLEGPYLVVVKTEKQLLTSKIIIIR